MRRRDNIKGDMKKYQLTEDMAQDRKYWMTKYWPAPHKVVVKKGEKGIAPNQQRSKSIHVVASAELGLPDCTKPSNHVPKLRKHE